MGKTYIDTVKYLVYANVEIDGMVEKPDVVGAIFGQTEGLLGDELDLRDLQKNGRIGRIEVDLQPRGGRSVGKIKLPSSLDMVETCILAAALETVDRVGPCEARITIEKVEDTRNAKRKQLVERAKSLLKNLLTNEIPESKEISDMVREEVKIAEIEEYGPEKLPCGPGIDKSDSIIIVEGRADVINLLKNDITNVIAVGGANITNTIVKLAREKEVTVFLDGDRGGDIILSELARVADIDFVARAPPGKEVEELTRKELIKCLRAKIPFEQGVKENDAKKDERRKKYEKEEKKKDKEVAEWQPETLEFEASAIDAPPVPPSEPTAPQEVPPQLLSALDELENTLRARFYNSELGLVKEIPVRDMIKSLEEEQEIYAIVFDGIITQRLADMAESKKVSILAAIKLGNVFRRPAGVLIYTKT
ncbi:MAG: DNA primase DnaG [Candidatus Anstonellaceae archaeon]